MNIRNKIYMEINVSFLFRQKCFGVNSAFSVFLNNTLSVIYHKQIFVVID